jgi:hypothetical protein
VKADSVQLENNIMKKIYFDGCSYTFGQSLELYCNSHDIFQHDRLSKYKFTESDLKFIKENRYTSIVSKHFEFDEVNKSIPGKSNGKILFDLNKQNIDLYEHVIIQLTHFGRYFTKNMHEWQSHEATIDFMLKNGYLTQEEIDYTIENIEKIQLDYFLQLEEKFKNYPNKLKIIFHSDEWEEILSKEQIQKYGINIEGEYMIKKWAEKNNMFINQQDEFKNSIFANYDTHLTPAGHKILAESIIKQL